MRLKPAPALGVRLLASAFAAIIHKIGDAKSAASNRTPKAGAELIRINLLSKI
ncbi:MAG: hypothetical protein NTX50_29985 [Candidatus Sumerlaeota bacterium]|nr:hypothetical protein [Candidatus Sumerlaeota bacterium]